MAILLVERSAYNTDIVTNCAATAPAGKKATKKKKTSQNSYSRTSDNNNQADHGHIRAPKEVREYALGHGVSRGGWQKLDAPPDGIQPLLNPESADEGLLTFVQSVTCCREVWAEAFESSITSTSSVSTDAQKYYLLT